MDVGVYSYQNGDPLLIDKIVNEFLSQGKFDKLRKECMSDADTKPAYQNLQQRVEATVTQFLKKQVWKPDLNKNQLRDSLRKHILESVFFDAGINRVVDQVVNPNVLATVFLPEVEEVVYSYLSIPRPDKNQKRVPISNAETTEKPTDDEDNLKASKNNDKGSKENPESQGDHGMVKTETGTQDEVNKAPEPPADDKTKINEIQKCQTIRPEVKVESDGAKKNEGNHAAFEEGLFDKMDDISDESQESVQRNDAQGFHLNDTEKIPFLESDNSVPLYINEKSMSDSRDSEDSIMNQMSPISQGRLTPDLIEEEKVQEKVEKEEKEEKEEEKKPLTFIGRIPKIKREDSETTKLSKEKKEDVSKMEKLDVKHVYSSDESDSSKSLGKSDSDERKSKEKKRDEDRNQQKDDKKSKDESDRKRKHDYHHRDSRDRDKDKRHRSDKSKDRSSKEQRRERSRERHGIKKSSSSSSSSYSREKSSSRHKSSRHESRRRSKEGSHEKRKKEHEKRKSKSTDDHGKERNKKEERRSTDRDSNEGEIDRSTNVRSQEESKKRDKDLKGEESKKDERSSKEDVQAEKEEEVIPVEGAVFLEMEEDAVPEDGTVVMEMEVDWISDEGFVVSNLEEGWISAIDIAEDTEDRAMPVEEVSVGTELYRNRPEVPDVLPALDFNELIQNGAMSRVEFPKLTDDFYVKFNSTGFKYFEEWEQSKLDCEEEFKDFVDEAENNLDLISDDGSDFELKLGEGFDFEVENRKTISNLHNGWGNFKKSLMFDPAKSEFYKWTNGKFYQKFRRKGEKRRGSLEKNESDESIKENIERRERVSGPAEAPKCQIEMNEDDLKRKALHLKLLNKYRRKAMRHGTHRRRHRRKKTSSESWGIKEKNENRSVSDVNIKNLRDCEPEKGFLFKSEVMGVSENYSGKLEGVVGFNLVEGENCQKSGNGRPEMESETNHRVNSLSQEKNDFERKSVSGLGNVENLESPVDSGVFLESPDTQKKKKEFVEEVVVQKPKNQSVYLKNESLKCDSLLQKCNLPLSPESDDANADKVNGVSPQNLTSRKNKRTHKSATEDGRKRRKPIRRNNCQKYDSQDLYKPRLLLNSSRVRSREKGSDVDY